MEEKEKVIIGNIESDYDGENEEGQPVYLPIYCCPVCDYEERHKFMECPQCKTKIDRWGW